MGAVYIVVAILIFGLLVAVHELGHFSVAKLFKVRVNEFAIGMGPVLFQRQKGETMYSLRAVPFGGFCAMEGEDADTDDPRGFLNQAPYKRILILVAGAAMNFLFGLLIVIILYSNAYAFRASIIADFMEGCPYERADALQKGDRIYKIDGKRIYQYYNVSEFLEKGDGVYELVVIRDGKKLTLHELELKPLQYPGESSLKYGFIFGTEEATLPVKLQNAWSTTMEFSRLVWMGLEELFSGNVGMQDMAGPVGIVDLMAETGEQAESTSDALYDIFYLGALIAVNLAIMNLLPIPALDGGRIFLLFVTLIIERISHKRLDPKYEGYINAAGMILLLALMALIMFNDIIRIVTT